MKKIIPILVALVGLNACAPRVYVKQTLDSLNYQKPKQTSARKITKKNIEDFLNYDVEVDTNTMSQEDIDTANYFKQIEEEMNEYFLKEPKKTYTKDEMKEIDRELKRISKEGVYK